MNKVFALFLIIGGTLFLIASGVFSSDGTFGDAKTQRDRASAISSSVTVPTTLP